MTEHTAYKVAFIGLGVMGYPMAGHLAKAGHDVTVYNRTGIKAAKWVDEYGGRIGRTPAEAAEEADYVFVCVGNDDDLRAVVLGETGAFHGMKSGATLVDHTTASADVAREIGGFAMLHGFEFMDAPVSGGQAGAENGALTIMVGGGMDVFEKVEPLMDCYARNITHMGEIGAGQLAKMVNQICIAGVVQGLAEGLNFAVAAGLDADKLLEVISQGAAQSWQMEHRGNTMVRDDFDFGFAVDWMRKDLSICMSTANQLGVSIPMTALVDQFYAQVQAMGGNRWDTSSLIVPLARMREMVKSRKVYDIE